MLKSVNDVLYKSYNFKIQLMMFVDDTGSPQNDKFKRNKIVNVSQSRNPNEHPSVYFDTYARALIGFCATSFDTNNKPTLGDHVYFSQKSFYEIDMALNVCTEWLRSKNFKHLFDVDKEGVVVGLGAAAPYNPSVYKNQSEFIRFFPAVVKDINGIKYEGVSIKSHKGALAQFTCGEFLAMASCVKSYILNMYGNNLLLLNSALNYIHMTSIKK